MQDIIFSGNPGALPHSFSYTPESDSPVIIYFSGSAWTSVANTPIGLKLTINGADITTTTIWSNGPTTHRALVPSLVKYKFPLNVVNGVVQPVTITISALANTIFDVNDTIFLAI